MVGVQCNYASYSMRRKICSVQVTLCLDNFNCTYAFTQVTQSLHSTECPVRAYSLCPCLMYMLKLLHDKNLVLRTEYKPICKTKKKRFKNKINQTKVPIH